MGSQNMPQGINLVFLVATFSVLIIIIGDHNVAAHLAPEAPAPSPSSLPPLSYISYSPADAPSGAPSDAPSSSPPLSPGGGDDGGFSGGAGGDGGFSGGFSGGAGGGVGSEFGASLPASSDFTSSASSDFKFDFKTGFNFDVDFNLMDAFKADLSKLTAGCDERIKKICQNTDYPEICLATIVPILKASGHTGAKLSTMDIWELNTKIAYGFANFSLGALDRFSKTPGLPEDVKTALDICGESFSDVLDSLENAVDAFSKHDIGTVSTMLSAAMTNCGDCEEAFKGLSYDCPVAGFADKLSSVSSNSLAIGSAFMTV
ncbi:OLC1v1020621C1 [Oldenlandia corymbosa var. corymbosa]|uniref:OLC1v1020621C1 n=1 Tax=Oldenlandia corymbosa var. corymbosa TaxID=529605 RepID=A0AAV1EH15_OLDCO|nr:OLC1v1020621C1 [Oldenlandia corymbosa var. corymbosa]